jgi:hypothetical protein
MVTIGNTNSPVNLGFCIKQIAIEFLSMENGSKIPKNPNRGKTQILDFKTFHYAFCVHKKKKILPYQKLMKFFLYHR